MCSIIKHHSTFTINFNSHRLLILQCRGCNYRQFKCNVSTRTHTLNKIMKSFLWQLSIFNKWRRWYDLPTILTYFFPSWSFILSNINFSSNTSIKIQPLLLIYCWIFKNFLTILLLLSPISLFTINFRNILS